MKSYDCTDIALEHGYIFIVLECHKHKKLEKIHGVYTTRSIAQKKALKVMDKNPDHGYVAVLKKTIEGPTRTPIFTY